MEEREKGKGEAGGGVVVRGMKEGDWDFLVGLCDEGVREGYERGRRRERRGEREGEEGERGRGGIWERGLERRGEMDEFTGKCFSREPPWLGYEGKKKEG